MNKDQFWSTSRLLPRGTSDHEAFSIHKNDNSLNAIANNCINQHFGKRYVSKNSKIIRSYSLSEEVLPTDKEILTQRIFKNAPSFVPCTAFSPSFASLSEEQKNYFLYFCQCIESCKVVKSAYPYLQLYLARYLRKGEHNFKISREIYFLWSSYRKEFPLVDKLICDFILDLCLYLRTSVPFHEFEEIMNRPDFTIRPTLCDLYVFDYLFADGKRMEPAEREYVLRTLTSQSFRRSKAYRHHSKFPFLTEDAVEKAFSLGIFNTQKLNDILLGIRIPSYVTTVRRLFSGLCETDVPNVKICIEHFPLLHDSNIRERCDGVVRYLENRLRAILKIKNSLSRIHIPEPHRIFLEGILTEYQRYSPEEEEKAEAPASESFSPQALHPREFVIDLEKANQIETQSREITKVLTEFYSDDEEAVTLGEEIQEIAINEPTISLASIRQVQAVDHNDFWEFAATLSEDEDRFIRISLHNGANEGRKFALSHGSFFETFLDRCNEKARETTGDGIFDSAGVLYEEYKNLLEEVFPPITGEEL